jgi:uncharacterized membrane protein
MSTNRRADAQQRADEIEIFRRELERLAREGALVLSEGQERAVAEHHDALLGEYAKAFDIDRDVRAKQLSLGMRIASFLGALALAASVFFFFYRYWGCFPPAGQVAILLVAALGSFGGTIWLQGKDASGYFSKLAAMVAFACFVLNIVMLGQIFNITPSDRALLVWAALALLLAYTIDLRLLLGAGILCLIGFISARTGTWCGIYWLYFGERPENFFPVAVALFFIPDLIPHGRFTGFAVIYRVFGLLTLFLPMLVLANWGSGSYLDMESSTVEVLYQILGFVASAAVIWLGARRRHPAVVNTGMTFFVIFLYTKFFDWWWKDMPKYLFFLVLGLTTVLFLVALQRIRRMTSAAARGGAA